MVNFGPLAAEIVSLVWGTPANFNGFRFLAALVHNQTAALNRGRHLYSAGRPSRWALAHISSFSLFWKSEVLVDRCRHCSLLTVPDLKYSRCFGRGAQRALLYIYSDRMPKKIGRQPECLWVCHLSILCLCLYVCQLPHVAVSSS